MKTLKAFASKVFGSRFLNLFLGALLLISYFQPDVKTVDRRVTITFGTPEAYAAGIADHSLGTNGATNAALIQAALNALPNQGGLFHFKAGTYNITTNASGAITRAIGNVTIEGEGRGTKFTGNGSFTAGGNQWVFRDLALNITTQISMGATTGWSWSNIFDGTTLYDERNPNYSVVGGQLTATTANITTLNAPTGRGATYVIAASDAPGMWRAQANLIDSGNLTNSIQTALNLGYRNIKLSPGNFTATRGTNIVQNNVIISGSGWETVIRVKNQPLAKLTANVTIGQTTISVNSTAGFENGEAVEFAYAAAGDSMTILTVNNATSITLTGPMASNYAINTTFDSIMSTFFFTGDDSTIENLKIDGNSANWPNIGFECGASYEIDFYANHFFTDRVEIVNSRHRPWRGRGNDTILQNSYFHDMSANGGIHYEGIASARYNHATIDKNTFVMPDGLSAVSPSVIISFGDFMQFTNNYVYGGFLLRASQNALISSNIFLPNDSASQTDVKLDGGNSTSFLHNSLHGAFALNVGNITIGATTYTPLDTVVSNNLLSDGAYISLGSGLRNITISNNSFHNITASNAIDGSGASGLINNVNIVNNLFNTVSNATYSSVKLISARTINILGNIFDNSGSVQIATCDYVNVVGNTVTSPVSHSFRFVTSSTNITVANNIINTSSYRGISLETNTISPATPVRIIGNFLGATTPFYTAGAYTNVILSKNIGYVTENSGSANITTGNNMVTILHGLASTPTWAGLSSSSNETGWMSWTANATSINITASANVSANCLIYWRATVGAGN